MNVRLIKHFHWSSGVVYQDNFAINHYSVELSMLTACDDHIDQNKAYDRLKTFIEEILQDSILVSGSAFDMAKWTGTGARVIAVPDEPVDQVIGIMLYTKLNAIMEQRMIVTDVRLSSRLGDDMIYLHSHGENPGPFTQDGWWNDHRPIWGLSASRPKKDKVVTMDRYLEWKNYGLDWGGSQPENNSDGTIVFADFPRNETE